MLRHEPQLHELEELADLDEPLPAPVPATCTMSAARKASMCAMTRRRGNVAGPATGAVAFVLLLKAITAEQPFKT